MIADGAGLDDEDRAVAFARDNGGIDDARKRRRINENIVKCAAQCVDHLREAPAVEELRRVRRELAGRDHIELRNVRRVHHVLEAVLAGEVVRETVDRLAACVDVAERDGLAHVRVDENGVLAGLREGLGETQRDGALAFIFRAAGDCDGLDVVAAELKVRADGLE